MTHLRRKAKNLVVNQRTIYKCELENCPTCGESLADCRHYSWSKTVQQLDQVIHVASQPKECRNPKCKDVGKRYVSAVAQTVALPGATYGLDVVAQIGWWKDREHLSGTEIYQRLSGNVSDKQGAVRVALNKVWQEVRHQWCQAHYLRNAAKPLQTIDHALKTDLRKDIREEIRTSLGQVGSTAENGAFSPSTSEWVSSL